MVLIVHKNLICSNQMASNWFIYHQQTLIFFHVFKNTNLPSLRLLFSNY